MNNLNITLINKLNNVEADLAQHSSVSTDTLNKLAAAIEEIKSQLTNGAQ